MTKDLTNMTVDEITRYKSTVYEISPFGPEQWAEINRVNEQIEEIEKGKK